ncbi:hypothetical protein CKA81_04335 [Pollutimonas thiosulfatoxidans]|uniref:Uncharacterized protein n=1 Tax=Pollutimonas thiosulfatoxidans TaxID=2028345 RepID=A0A410GA09_9BURK|nr:hypothetical protein CKA81_04335 [Pollutimonas thiosulfatoxidans]
MDWLSQTAPITVLDASRQPLPTSRQISPNAKIGPAGGAILAACNLLLTRTVGRKHAKHIDRPSDGGLYMLQWAVGWPAVPGLWGRASRTRRQPERANERGDAMFGAQGAEPAPWPGTAGQPTAHVNKTQPHTSPIPQTWISTAKTSRNTSLQQGKMPLSLTLPPAPHL